MEELKIGWYLKGKKKGSWKGGISPIHKLIRHSAEYKRWRNYVLKRDKWTCINCGQVGRELQVDHIKPFSLFPDLRFETNNGRTFCKSCHQELGWKGSHLQI